MERSYHTSSGTGPSILEVLVPGPPHPSSAARAAVEDERGSARHSWSRFAASRGKVLLTVLSWMGDLRGGSSTSAWAWSGTMFLFLCELGSFWNEGAAVYCRIACDIWPKLVLERGSSLHGQLDPSAWASARLAAVGGFFGAKER